MDGLCYEDAWRFLIKEEEGELIHGSVTGADGKTVNHAWVELPTGYVWEPQSKEFIKTDIFYSTFKPKVERRYTPTQAAIIAAKTRNFGPWTEQEAGNPREVKRMEQKGRKVVSERTGEDSYGAFRETVYEENGIYVKERHNDGRHAGYHAQTTFSVALEPNPVTWIAPFNSYEDAYRFYKPSLLKEPVKPGRVEEIERHRLSDGGLARITRLGHTYTFMRGFASLDEPPEITMDLTLDQARKLLADTLRSDVLESEGSLLREVSMDERVKAIAEEAAVKAVELQGNKIAQQLAKELSGEVLHQSPISAHCQAVLETPPKCFDFRGARSFCLCWAWNEMEKKKLSRLPVREAWQELRRVCQTE